MYPHTPVCQQVTHPPPSLIPVAPARKVERGYVLIGPGIMKGACGSAPASGHQLQACSRTDSDPFLQNDSVLKHFTKSPNIGKYTVLIAWGARGISHPWPSSPAKIAPRALYENLAMGLIELRVARCGKIHFPVNSLAWFRLILYIMSRDVASKHQVGPSACRHRENYHATNFQAAENSLQVKFPSP